MPEGPGGLCGFLFIIVCANYPGLEFFVYQMHSSVYTWRRFRGPFDDYPLSLCNSLWILLWMLLF